MLTLIKFEGATWLVTMMTVELTVFLASDYGTAATRTPHTRGKFWPGLEDDWLRKISIATTEHLHSVLDYFWPVE